MASAPAPPRLDRNRNRAVRRLFFRIAAHVLWWDIILTRGPLRRFRRPATPRWVVLARDFRRQAEELGGVLIKLGQFVSARVDLLPKEVIDVMAGLHDAVPAAPAEAVVAQIETDFATPISRLFPAFEPVPVGAASLAQAHRARLRDGRSVVVKVLRPGIEDVVENDLHVIGRYIRRLRRFKAIRRRVDLELLANEFVTVTRKELDLVAEAHNCQRFTEAYRDDPEIYTPRIYWDASGPRTLTMEDVSYFPIQDVAGYEAAGIARDRIARKLMDCYLDQVFLSGFVHADPHPGNLFVRPLPAPGEATSGWSPPLGGCHRLPVPYAQGRPFQLVFVDFGMAVTIPEHARRSLTTYAIGMGTRDAYTIIQSYIEGDLLLPDTDLDELEAMTAALLNRFPSAFVGQVRHHDLEQYGKLFEEYQTLLYHSPMKMKADMLFVFRAMGVCAGTVARIDPTFNPADRFLALAQRLLADEWQPSPDRFKRILVFAAQLPSRLDGLLTQIERGKLKIHAEDVAWRKEIRLMTRAANRLAIAVIAAGTIIGGALLWRIG